MQSANAISASLIIVLLIEAGEIQSLNYTAPLPGSPYAQAGTRLDLTNGDIVSTAIAVDGATGALSVRGDITADAFTLTEAGDPVIVFDDYPVTWPPAAGDYYGFVQLPVLADPLRVSRLGFNDITQDILIERQNFGAAPTARAFVSAAGVSLSVEGALSSGSLTVLSDELNVNVPDGRLYVDTDVVELGIVAATVNVNEQPMFASTRYAVATSFPSAVVGTSFQYLAQTIVIPSAPYDRVGTITCANILTVSVDSATDYLVRATGGTTVSARNRFGLLAVGARSCNVSLSFSIAANAPATTIEVGIARTSGSATYATSGGSDFNRIDVVTHRSSP